MVRDAHVISWLRLGGGAWNTVGWKHGRRFLKEVGDGDVGTVRRVRRAYAVFRNNPCAPAIRLATAVESLLLVPKYFVSRAPPRPALLADVLACQQALQEIGQLAVFTRWSDQTTALHTAFTGNQPCADVSLFFPLRFLLLISCWHCQLHALHTFRRVQCPAATCWNLQPVIAQ